MLVTPTRDYGMYEIYTTDLDIVSGEQVTLQQMPVQETNRFASAEVVT